MKSLVFSIMVMAVALFGMADNGYCGTAHDMEGLYAISCEVVTSSGTVTTYFGNLEIIADGDRVYHGTVDDRGGTSHPYSGAVGYSKSNVYPLKMYVTGLEFSGEYWADLDAIQFCPYPDQGICIARKN